MCSEIRLSDILKTTIMNKDTHHNIKIGVILGISLLVFVVVILIQRIPQDPCYHNFADQRRIAGIPNFWNVITNLPFLLVGLAGFRLVAGGKFAGGLRELRANYMVFFIGIILIGLGSAYYHISPTNRTLVWDRLPMTVSFMAFFSAIVGEHLSCRAGRLLLWPLLLAGLSSVLYWYVSEVRGSGDLRFYALVQFLPMLLMPYIIILFRSGLSGSGYLWAVLGIYAASKVAELLDGEIFRLLGAISGHSIKHLLAALAAYYLVVALKRRSPLKHAPDGG